MSHPTPARRHGRLPRAAMLLFAGLAGAAVAVAAGLASASSFTLSVEKNVHVTNDPAQVQPFRVKPVNTHESVAAGPAGYAVYTFQGETTHHLICKRTTMASTNCWAFWPPVSVGSAKGVSKQKGIKGRLGTFRNHGMRQLTLNGQPLYYFTPDIKSRNKRQAMGDELKTFGSIWHVVVAGGAPSGSTSPASTMSTTTMTTGTTPSPYPY